MNEDTTPLSAILKSLDELASGLKTLNSRVDFMHEHIFSSQEPSFSKLSSALSGGKKSAANIAGGFSSSARLLAKEKETATPSKDYDDEDLPLPLSSAYLSRTQQRKKLGDLLDSVEAIDDDRQHKARNPRRESVLFRQIEKASAAGNQLVIHGQQPTFEHIKLSTLVVWSVFDFFDKVVEYETTHKIALPVNALVGKLVREELISRYAPDLTLERFYTLSQTELYLLAQDVVKPHTPHSFLESLDKNVEFASLPSGYVPTVTNFMPFYRAILLYKTRFLRVYEFLATHNSDNVPPCHNKEGGLLKFFLDKLPHEFGKRMWQHINRQRLQGRDKKDYTLHSFLKTFTDLLQDALGIAESARSFKELFGGTAYEKKKQDSMQLHALLETRTHDDQQDIQEAATATTVATAAAAATAGDDSDNDQYLQFAQLQKKPFVQKVTAATTDHKYDEHACFEKVFHDKCSKEKCKWSHDLGAVRKARDNFEQLLLQLKRTSGTGGTPQRIAQRSISNIHDRRTPDATDIAAAEDQNLEDYADY